MNSLKVLTKFLKQYKRVAPKDICLANNSIETILDVIGLDRVKGRLSPIWRQLIEISHTQHRLLMWRDEAFRAKFKSMDDAWKQSSEQVEMICHIMADLLGKILRSVAMQMRFVESDIIVVDLDYSVDELEEMCNVAKLGNCKFTKIVKCQLFNILDTLFKFNIKDEQPVDWTITATAIGKKLTVQLQYESIANHTAALAAEIIQAAITQPVADA